MDKFTFLIQEELSDERIDKCLSLLIDTISRSYIQKLIKEDNVLVVEDFSFDMPKTKNMVKVLSALKLQDKKTLFVVNTDPKNFVTLSARNIANVKVMNAASVNAYEVLNAKKLVFSETAIVELDKMYANS